MSNEVLLVLSIFIIYGSVIAFFKLFGKQGLYCFTVLATIAANIEVLIVIVAFGMEMTLGNVLFASTFLVTDIISELYGKKESRKAVHIGIATSVTFIIFPVVAFVHTIFYGHNDGSNENYFFKYSKNYDCQYVSVCNSSGI